MLLALGAAHRAKAILPALENRGLRTGKQGLGPHFVKLLCLRVCKGLEALGLGLKIFSLCSDAVV